MVIAAPDVGSDIDSDIGSGVSDPNAARAVAGAPPVDDDLHVVAERFGDALAMLAGSPPILLWATSALRAALPGAEDGQPFAGVAADVPMLTDVLERLDTRVPSRHRVPFPDGEERELAVEPLPGGRAVARLRALDGGGEDELRRYVHARESLFSTSRTISVSEMASTLAHEINQPIGAIAGVLRGVRARLDRPEPALDGVVGALDQALDQTRFVSSVIVRIRDFTRSRRPARERVDVARLAAESVALLDWLLTRSRVEISVAVTDDAPEAVGDATMLQQVLVNLLRNAIDACRGLAAERRSITITIGRDADMVALDVRDRGRGIEDAETLFAPFVTGKPDGTGIGLSICRSFVELHQGRLWLAPHAEGCTAHLRLPAAEGAGGA